MAPVIDALNAFPQIEVSVCVTAQHRQMLDQVLNLFEIIPDYDLDVMKINQSLSDLTANLIMGLDQVFGVSSPDLVLVHGDTTTTLAATLSAYYRQIPVGHVEAGLRTGDIYSPWPEEVNRKVTSSIAKLNFAPTDGARKNLLSENVDEKSITVTGNTVIDSLFATLKIIKQTTGLAEKFDQQFGILPEKRLLLVTGHRRESFGSGFERICRAIKALSERDDLQVIYPVHLNPNVQDPVNRWLGGLDNVSLIPPQDYLPFVHLMSRSHLILTDSGGVQEEAPSLGKPVLVMRDTTERPEAVDAGTVLLVGTDADRIVSHCNILLDDPTRYCLMSEAHNPYGDGRAASRIADAVAAFANSREG